MTKQWRILVSGVGSVGERHIRNLIALGQGEIAVHRTRAIQFRTLDREFPTYSALAHALADWRPNVVFVTGPTALHLNVAKAAVEAGCHVFVEKPLTHAAEGIEALEAALARTGRSVMIGYMLRFHPLLVRLKDWLEDGTLGRPLYWRSSWGEYLPDWHHWEDYRDSYAARRDLGGGPALTLSHDLDLALWLFGDVQRGYALTMPESSLRLDFPPGLDLLLRHANGVAASVHFDFYQRPPQRSYELVATGGRAVVDYYAGQLILYSYPDDDAPSRRTIAAETPDRVVGVPEVWDRNDMFVAELRYFFECLDTGEVPQPGLSTGAAIAEITAKLGDGGVWDALVKSVK